MAMRLPARCALLVFALAALGGCAAPSAEAPARATGPGRLRIVSNPAGARIIVDDAPTNFRTPTTFPLPAGTHRVILSLVSHRNWESQARIEPGSTTQLEATLVSLGTGSISVGSSPPGAQVLIDGEAIGSATPADLPRLSVGTHTVQLRKEGFEDWSQAIVVRQGRHFAFQGVLVPLRKNLGSIAVNTQPPAALISLDGVPTERVSPATIRDVPAGSHVVDLTLAGYRPWSGTVTVQEGKERSLLVSLRHLPAQEVGSMRIESDPPGAAITLNGVPLRQKSPADIVALPPGTFALELARPGCRPWRGELTVLPGERTLLQVRLEQQQ